MSQPTSSHKRKISFHDLNLTFKRSATGPGPLVPPPTAPGPPQLTAQQIQQQHLEQTRRADLARRQAKKPTDREIPDELAPVVVGDGVERYKKLRDVERRLDAVMMRKRLDVSDNLQRRYTRREGVLRVWISNTADGQPWQVIEEEGAGSIGLGEDGTFEFGESGQANFRVKMEGRLLDYEEDEGAEAKDAQQPDSTAEGGDKKEDKLGRKRPYFSHFLKSITIEFDRNPALQPDGYSAIEWRKPAPSNNSSNANNTAAEANFDALEFERKGDENMNVTINLVRDEKNERFKLSPLLAEILDTEEEDRAGAVQGIWEYCRAMGLQEDEDKRTIVCDEPLRKVRSPTTFEIPSTLRNATTNLMYDSSSAKRQSTSPTSPTSSSHTSTPSPRSNSPTQSASTNPTSTARPPTPPQTPPHRPPHHPKQQSTTSASPSPTS